MCLDQCETMIIKINGEYRLIEVLYVLDLGINLLSKRRFTKCELRRSFDNDDLYIYIKKNIEVLRAPTRDNIYIVDKVISLDEFALTTVTALNSELTFFVSVALSAITISNKFISNSKP